MTRENLIELSIRHQTDKWGAHHYARHYEHHLARFREKKVVMLEIGIGGYADPLAGGASLRVWSDWFTHPETIIIGVDIQEKKLSFDDPRVRIHRGSQVDESFLSELHRLYGDFDIVLDDGSHLPEHVISTFNFLYPKTKDGGIYIVEDTQTSYWQGGRASRASFYNPENPTLNFFKAASDWVNYAEIPLPSDPVYRELHTVGVHFYHNLIILDKDRNEEGSNILASRLGGEASAFMRPLISVSPKGDIPALGLLAHIGGVGDVVNLAAPHVATDGKSPRFIQGVQLLCDSADEQNIEYRARFKSGEWSEWVQGNAYVGTRGKSEPLSGFAFRLAGEWKGKYELLATGAFLATKGLMIVGDGVDCAQNDEIDQLFGIQVVLSRSLKEG